MNHTRIDPVEPAACAIAAFGLEGVSEPASFKPSAREWVRLLDRISLERVSGLAVESARAGWLGLDEEQMAELLEFHRAAMAWSLEVERKILVVAEAFDAAGIEFAVLKGPSLAHTQYAEPCLRPFRDADVLVRTRDYERACRLLDDQGHQRQRPEPRAHWEVRFGKASVHKDPDDGIEVDLHRTLVLGPFGLWMDAEELLDRRVSFELGGHEIPRLDDTGMLLNVIVHAALGWQRTRLAPLRDLAQVARFGAVDFSVLEDWISRWKLSAVVQRAIEVERAYLHVESLPVGFVSEPVRRSEARALRSYVGEARSRGGTALSTIRAIPRMRDKIAYMSALLAPDREFLDGRSARGGRGTYRRRLMTPVSWAVARVQALGRLDVNG